MTASLENASIAARPPTKAAGVVALAGAVGAYGASLSIISTTASLYLADAVHTGALAIGLFFTGRGAIGIVVTLAAGRASDRMRDRRLALALAGLAAALGAACFALLHGYVAAFLAGAVLLNLGGVAFSQLFAYAREHAEARERAATAFTSAIRSVFSAAWVIGPPFGFYLLTRYGFRPLYLTAAGLFLIVAVLGRWGLPRIPAGTPRAATAAERRLGKRLLGPLRGLERRTYALLAAIVLFGVVNQVYGIDIALYVTKDLHLSSSLVGWMAGLSAGLEIPVMLLAGRFADRLGKRRLVIAAAGGAALFCCLLTLVRSAPVLLVLQIPNAAWTAVALSIPMIMVQDEVPGGAGTSSALYSTAYTTAGLIAGAVTGVTAAALGFRDVFWVCAGLSVLALVLLVGRGVFRRRGGLAPH